MPAAAAPPDVSVPPSDVRLNVLAELLTCGDTIPLWIYGADLHLIRAGSDQLVLGTIFEHTGCLAYMKEHFEENNEPIILSSYLGLMWCAVKGLKDTGEAVFTQYYVIGPVVNTDISPETVRDAARRFHVDMNWREGFTRLIQSLSVVPSSLFFQYALMLHYCVTEEKLLRSDLAFQKSGEQTNGSKKTAAVRKDRALTYRNEQRILDHVRRGDPDYAAALETGHRLSDGIRVSTGDPLQQMLLSTASFTSLCTRAAIEGGLSPDTAYAVGDSYIQSLASCKSLTEMRAINHAMYEDFIQRVHKLRGGPSFSTQVQSSIEYIELHPSEDLSIRELAKRVGYTDYYLSRKFKEETGSSIGSYILKVRLEQAKALLAGTDLTVAEIAEQLRFCSASYFSGKFRALTGLLPGQYRKEQLRL